MYWMIKSLLRSLIVMLDLTLAMPSSVKMLRGSTLLKASTMSADAIRRGEVCRRSAATLRPVARQKLSFSEHTAIPNATMLLVRSMARVMPPVVEYSKPLNGRMCLKNMVIL